MDDHDAVHDHGYAAPLIEDEDETQQVAGVEQEPLRQGRVIEAEREAKRSTLADR